MIIPKSFKIFAQTWTVKQVNKVVVDGESLMGHCDPNNCIILLRKNLKRELKELVFWHEATHAMLFSLEYNKLAYDETFVERVSKALHQVLTTIDNG